MRALAELAVPRRQTDQKNGPFRQQSDMPGTDRSRNGVDHELTKTFARLVRSPHRCRRVWIVGDRRRRLADIVGDLDAASVATIGSPWSSVSIGLTQLRCTVWPLGRSYRPATSMSFPPTTRRVGARTRGKAGPAISGCPPRATMARSRRDAWSPRLGRRRRCWRRSSQLE
jgi:hypothetical protein